MDLNTLMTIGAVASSAFGVGFYLKDQINKATKEFTEALTTHRLEDGEKFHDHALRISAVELKLYGVTHSGKNPDRMDAQYTS